MIAEYLGIEYETTMYEVTKKEDGSWDRSAWFDKKFTLGIPFPNLPYLIDGEVKISESMAVLKYLARKGGKCIPTTNEDWAMAENLEGIVNQVRDGFLHVCYMGASPEDWFLKNGKSKLEVLDKFLEGKNWLINSLADPSYLDFFLWEIVDHHVMYKPDVLSGLGNLQAWYERFQGLEAIKKYHSGQNFTKWPINNKMAWGGDVVASELHKF